MYGQMTVCKQFEKKSGKKVDNDSIGGVNSQNIWGSFGPFL
jgi:hypothetical protein